MHITEIGTGAAPPTAALQELSLPGDPAIYLISLDARPGDPFEHWIGDCTRQLTMALQQEYASSAAHHKCLIILCADDHADPFTQAAADGCWEALRGIVHVLTVEKGASRLVLNLIRCRMADAALLSDAASFLLDPHADFCAGSTFDMRDWT